MLRRRGDFHDKWHRNLATKRTDTLHTDEVASSSSWHCIRIGAGAHSMCTTPCISSRKCVLSHPTRLCAHYVKQACLTVSHRVNGRPASACHLMTSAHQTHCTDLIILCYSTCTGAVRITCGPGDVGAGRWFTLYMSNTTNVTSHWRRLWATGKS